MGMIQAIYLLVREFRHNSPLSRLGSRAMALAAWASFAVGLGAALGAPAPASADGLIEIDFSPTILDRIAQRVEKSRLRLTVPRCKAAPVIDDTPGDAAWSDAARLGPLPRGGELATTARLCHDGQVLYLQVVCKDRPGRAPVVLETRHDGQAWRDDCIEIQVQPSLNQPQYYFIVNAGGARYEAVGDDASYDPDWSAAVKRGEGQWTLEVAIPAVAVGLKQWPREIGFNLGRNAPGVGLQSWYPVWHDTSASSLVLEGCSEASPAETGPAKPSPEVGTAGTSLRLRMDRQHVRPGERWLEAVVHLEPQHTPPAETRLEIRLHRLAALEPTASLSVVPQATRAALRIDLRTARIDRGELSLELFEKGRQTGAAKALVSLSQVDPVKTGRRIAVQLDVPEGVGPLGPWPVTFGVPFPVGTLWDAGPLRLVDRVGREISCQKEITGRWARDGAIQWVRFDAMVEPDRGCFVEIAAPGAATSAPAIRLTEQGQEVIVETGIARHVLGRGPSPLREVWLHDRRIASAAGSRGLYVVDQKGRTAVACADDELMVVEARGPVASCVRFEGSYKTPEGEQLARHITRVESHAGQAAARITHTLVLSRDTNEVWFREIGWELAIEPGGAPEAWFSLSPTEHERRLSVPLTAATPSPYMLQDTHYLFGHGKNHFLVGVGGAGPPAVKHEGGQCGDWAALVGASGGLQVACRDAARQHPKEFEARAGKLVLKLFSNRGGEELDFRHPALAAKWDLANWLKKAWRGYGRVTDPGYLDRFLRSRSNAIGWAKTHQLLVNPLRPADAAGAARAARLHRTPVYALVDPWWIYESKALGSLYPRDQGRFPEAEQAQEAVMRWWIDADRAWGENGLVDYFAGPRLMYGNGVAQPYRYAYVTYTLRTNIWRVYARSGSRAVREFCEGTTRAYMDNNHVHVDPPSGGPLVRGLFRNCDQFFDLPIYWGDQPAMEIQSSTNFNNYLWFYHLTGERRARDVVEAYAEGIQRIWTLARAKRDERVLTLMRLLVQCYGLTGNPDLRALAEATADIFEDRAGELLLSKERPYRSSSYKTQVDVRALIDAWEVLGSPRFRDMAMASAEFWWRSDLGTDTLGYNVPMAVIGSFLYNQTGEPRYAQSVAMSLGHMAAQVRRGLTNPQPPFYSAEKTAFAFELDTALDLLVRSGADRGLAASWIGYTDLGDEATVCVRKSDAGVAELWFKTPAPTLHQRLTGATDGVRVNPLGLPAGLLWGHDLTRLSETSARTGVLRIPKDAPAGAHQLSFALRGTTYVVANAKLPLVLYAPGYWAPAPLQLPAARYYFLVPKESHDAQILFSVPARLFDPAGAAFGVDGTVKGWTRLPADRPGLWSFEVDSTQQTVVRVRNLPPAFAVGSPASYFTPDIPWQREALAEPPPAIPPSTVFVPGAIVGQGNQAVYLTGRRCLRVLAGPPHASGDGSTLLPHKQGTVEFFLQPQWDSIDRSDGRRTFCCGRMQQPGGNNYFWLNHELDTKLLTTFIRARDREGGETNVVPSRHTFFQPGRWVHIAWVWGTRSAVYVDGRLGDQRPVTMTGPPVSAIREFLVGYDRPEWNIDAVIDELRISDIERYTGEFSPPARDREFALDPHTRLLMHFNGDLSVESASPSGPAPVTLLNSQYGSVDRGKQRKLP